MSEDLTVTMDSPGVTDVPGFTAAGITCDVRGNEDGRLDLALIYSHLPCAAAGVFTRNAVCAAPVLVCREILKGGGLVHGIVANSGNANACTGAEGKREAWAMAEKACEVCATGSNRFLVASTGRIGERLPIPRILSGVAAAGRELSSSAESGRKAAAAILTSDTGPKTVTVRFAWGGKSVSVAGTAKGAGMIQPGMATMLAFLATDLAVPSEVLQAELAGAVDMSFNRITVDGDMSTNDTVLLLANGASGLSLDPGDGALRSRFAAAVRRCCEILAEKIVADGEKITKVVEVNVRGAESEEDAEKTARAIGNSLLVKTSWFGSDPNWGRLAAAAGYSGARIDPDKLDIYYGDVPALLSGAPQSGNKPLWKDVVRAKRFSITLDLNLGRAAFRLLATDLTEGYVNFNKSE